MLVDLMKSERASNAQGKSALVSPASAACQLNEVKRVLLPAFGSASRTSERLRTGLRRGAQVVRSLRCETVVRMSSAGTPAFMDSNSQP